MPTRDIIVVGGSAGSVGALVQLARDLPEDLPAAIFVVVHTSPEAPRLLDQILGRRSRMPVDYASDGDAVRSGRILLAPPDCHLILDDGLVRLSRGPNENRFRPAIDPLFRSAAESYGRRVAGVILSGVLDDGTFGLLGIKRRGGVAIVQDLDDAMFASMPRSALASVEVDHVVPAAEMANLLTRLAADGRRGGARTSGARTSMETRPRRRPAETIAKNEDPIYDNSPAPYACPECGGALWEADEGSLLRFRCRIGHAYNAESLLGAQDDGVEDALWTALRALEETAALRRRMAERMSGRGLAALAEGYEKRAAEADRKAAAIRSVIERGEIRAADVAASGGSRRATKRESSSRKTRSAVRSSR